MASVTTPEEQQGSTTARWTALEEAEIKVNSGNVEAEKEQSVDKVSKMMEDEDESETPQKKRPRRSSGKKTNAGKWSRTKQLRVR